MEGESDRKVLLLTGWWLPEYAPAASLVLSCVFKMKAVVHGVSQRRLASELHDAVGKYDDVYILGVALGTNPAEVADGVLRVREAGARVVWISGYELPPELNEVYRVRGGESCFDSMVICNNKDLFSAIKKAFPEEISKQDLDFFKSYAVKRPKEGSEQAAYRERFQAADWRHKTYREYEDYTQAISDLARRVKAAAFREGDVKRIEFYRRWGNRELNGESRHIREVKRMVAQAAKYEDPRARVLITGPSGTGKETVAQQIHVRTKSRRDAAFLSFNCACTTTGLLESRLFGYAEGAFTDAKKGGSMGLLESAEGGTLFLDEVGELDMDAQAMLLRVMQDGYYQRVGDATVRQVKNVRVIAATNRDLVKMVREGDFREDLYHRLNVIQIRMLPLAERKEDIEPIANTLWAANSEVKLTKDQLEALRTYDYPGNVRELENMLMRASALEITDFKALVENWKRENAGLHLEPDEEVPAVEKATLARDESLDAAMRDYVRSVYGKYRSTMSKGQIARDVLKVSRGTLGKYLAK